MIEDNFFLHGHITWMKILWQITKKWQVNNTTVITTGSANQRPNIPCHSLCIPRNYWEYIFCQYFFNFQWPVKFMFITLKIYCFFFIRISFFQNFVSPPSISTHCWILRVLLSIQLCISVWIILSHMTPNSSSVFQNSLGISDWSHPWHIPKYSQ